jgi:hypothetical protein
MLIHINSYQSATRWRVARGLLGDHGPSGECSSLRQLRHRILHRIRTRPGRESRRCFPGPQSVVPDSQTRAIFHLIIGIGRFKSVESIPFEPDKKATCPLYDAENSGSPRSSSAQLRKKNNFSGIFSLLAARIYGDLSRKIRDGCINEIQNLRHLVSRGSMEKTSGFEGSRGRRRCRRSREKATLRTQCDEESVIGRDGANSVASAMHHPGAGSPPNASEPGRGPTGH